MVLASELSVDAVLQRIVDLAVEITDARYGALGVLTPDRSAIEDFITVGISPELRAAIGDPPVGHGVLGVLIDEAGPIRIRDITRGSAFRRLPAEPPADAVVPGGAGGGPRHGVRQHLPDREGERSRVHAGGRGRARGAWPPRPGSRSRTRVSTRRRQRAQRDLARLELMEERERIAKELHDGVIQSLFAVGMGLQGTAATSTDPDVARRLESAVDEIDRAIRDLRNYIFGLRPGILADRHLGHAIQRLGEELQSKAGVLVIVDVDPDLAAELIARAANIVPIVQEALSNVGRHAGATTCRVSLARHDGRRASSRSTTTARGSSRPTHDPAWVWATSRSAFAGSAASSRSTA